MNRLVIDSSLYVAFANPLDEHFLDSQLFLENLVSKGQLLTPRLVVIEVINVLNRLKVKEVDLIESVFRGGELVELDERVQEVIMGILPQVKLKSLDLIIVATAKLYEAQLVSWDKKLVREANKVVKAYTPVGGGR